MVQSRDGNSDCTSESKLTWCVLHTVVVCYKIALITHNDFCLKLFWVVYKGVLAGGSMHIIHLQIRILSV